MNDIMLLSYYIDIIFKSRDLKREHSKSILRRAFTFQESTVIYLLLFFIITDPYVWLIYYIFITSYVFSALFSMLIIPKFEV